LNSAPADAIIPAERWGLIQRGTQFLLLSHVVLASEGNDKPDCGQVQDENQEREYYPYINFLHQDLHVLISSTGAVGLF
jgi:hypothetical protein